MRYHISVICDLTSIKGYRLPGKPASKSKAALASLWKDLEEKSDHQADIDGSLYPSVGAPIHVLVEDANGAVVFENSDFAALNKEGQLETGYPSEMADEEFWLMNVSHARQSAWSGEFDTDIFDEAELHFLETKSYRQLLGGSKPYYSVETIGYGDRNIDLCWDGEKDLKLQYHVLAQAFDCKDGTFELYQY